MGIDIGGELYLAYNADSCEDNTITHRVSWNSVISKFQTVSFSSKFILLKEGKKMFKFLYVICTGLTMLLFYLCNKFTEQLIIKDGLGGGGGNGNPGLFPWLFLFPFFLGFLLGTYMYTLKWIRKLKNKSIYYVILSSFFFIISNHNFHLQKSK
ncbi:hypothetical protein ACQKP0_13245 [Heyndrickxia sp. NPDC080065]|uniref:hypothetical protein n=1 Tax=Heyndrickxia sp. NPDC080065 TaxID=3390568 RepID=UPI003D008F08